MHDTLDSGIILPFNFFSTSSSQTYSKESNFEHDDSGYEPLKEQALCQSVIMQAILDATHAPINQKTRKEKTQAIIWLSISNKDFLFVCEMAGMDPLLVINGTKKAIKQSTVKNRRRQQMKRLRTIRHKKEAYNFTSPEKLKSHSGYSR